MAQNARVFLALVPIFYLGVKVCWLGISAAEVVVTGGTMARGKPLNEDLAVTTNKITMRDDFPDAPICPHCDKEIQEIAARRIESTLGVRFVYYCTACRKVLGVSHRKGFWMG